MGGEQRQLAAAGSRESLRFLQRLAEDGRNQGPDPSMIETIEDLFRRQAIAWPQLAAGLRGLAAARTRRMKVGWSDVYLRLIPHRLASSTAATDPDSVAKRPCFLCGSNMPAEEEGAPFDD